MTRSPVHSGKVGQGMTEKDMFRETSGTRRSARLKGVRVDERANESAHERLGRVIDNVDEQLERMSKGSAHGRLSDGVDDAFDDANNVNPFGAIGDDKSGVRVQKSEAHLGLGLYERDVSVSTSKCDDRVAMAIEMLAKQMESDKEFRLMSGRYDVFDGSNLGIYSDWIRGVKARGCAAHVSDDVKLRHLEYCMGGRALDQYRELNKGATWDTAMAYMDRQYGDSYGKGREICEFMTRDQREGESIKEYANVLRALVGIDMRNEAYDMVMITKLRSGLLKDEYKSMALMGSKKGHKYEQIIEDLVVHEEVAEELRRSKRVGVSNRRVFESRGEEFDRPVRIYCTNCERRGDHHYSACPFPPKTGHSRHNGLGNRVQMVRVVRCFNCGQAGHKSYACRTQRFEEQQRIPVVMSNDVQQGNEHVHESVVNMVGSDMVTGSNAPNIFVKNICVKAGNYLADTGAGPNLVSLGFANRAGVSVYNCSQTLSAVNGTNVKCLGRCTLEVKLPGVTRMVEFHIVPKLSHDVLLGNGTLKDFGVRLVGPGNRDYMSVSAEEDVVSSVNQVRVDTEGKKKKRKRVKRQGKQGVDLFGNFGKKAVELSMLMCQMMLVLMIGFVKSMSVEKRVRGIAKGFKCVMCVGRECSKNVYWGSSAVVRSFEFVGSGQRVKLRCFVKRVLGGRVFESGRSRIRLKSREGHSAKRGRSNGAVRCV